jgi:hypothetical protein
MAIINNLDFWNQALDILEAGTPGGRTSRAEYYADGEAQPGEWGNVITTIFQRTEAGSSERKAIVSLLEEAGFWVSTDNLDYWVGLDANDPDRAADITSLALAGENRLPNLTYDATPWDAPGQPGDQSGGPGAMIGGGDLIRIPGDVEKWGMRFTLPSGIEHIYTFDSEAAMKASLGNDAVERLGVTIVPEAELDDGDTWLLGDAAMWAGQEGTYQAYWEGFVQETALASGIRDPGRAGRMANDPKIAQILAEAAQGEWSMARTQAELRQTEYWTEVLYPGIEKFYATGTANPEADWRKYSSDVEENMRLLGIEKDEDGSFTQSIGRMLDGNIEADTFNAYAGIYKRALDNPELAEALNFWMQDAGSGAASFDDIFDVLAGLDTDEVTDAVEKGIIQYHANLSQTSLSAEMITNIANLTQLSEEQIAGAFNFAEEQLLSLGDRGLARYNLSEEKLVNAAFELGTAGESANEIRSLAKKTILELGLADDRKAQFFQSFDQSGRPFRPGLVAGAPERG